VDLEGVAEEVVEVVAAEAIGQAEMAQLKVVVLEAEPEDAPEDAPEDGLQLAKAEPHARAQVLIQVLLQVGPVQMIQMAFVHAVVEAEASAPVPDQAAAVQTHLADHQTSSDPWTVGVQM
jgi:hypothetical protein